MVEKKVLARIDGPVVLIGFGSIGRGVLPLLERHIDFDPKRLVVIDPSDADRHLLDERGIRFIQTAITRDNYRDILTPLLTVGGGQGFCINLSVDTSSHDIMDLARSLGALYIDTVAEPWLGFYFDPSRLARSHSRFTPPLARWSNGCFLLRCKSRYGLVVC